MIKITKNKRMEQMSKIYNIGSLFAGVGGVCLGFKNANNNSKKFNLVWANEIDEYACNTYRENFEHSLIEGDIRKVLKPSIIDKEIDKIHKEMLCCEENIITQKKSDLEELITEKKHFEEAHKKILESKIDILLGGFPCQAFSIAGYRRGFDDERGNLFLSIIDLIEQLDEIHGKPRVLFLENVKNLTSHDNGNTYKTIVEMLEEYGYKIKAQVLNTMDFSDLPQNRERIYIVAFLEEDDYENFNVFEQLEQFRIHKTGEQRIEDIRNIIDYNSSREELEKYYYTHEKYPKYFLSMEEYDALPLSERKIERVNLEEQINEMYQFYQVRRGMYVRRNMSGVCPTLTANMGTGGHNVPLIRVNDGIRKITPEEAFKLQGFPIGNGYRLPYLYKNKPFADSHLYKQAGNAVSVPVIKFLAEQILNVLD
jgi:DNA (cytosine-5)-methyltransferase 1